MNFLIADTFTDSLARLTGDEQKAVKTTAFDLQIDSAHPSLSLHKLDRAKDKNFWSVRVSSDIRLIVHRTADSILLCYVNHHDKAYEWAERRKLETHPVTGAAQLVEIRETIQEILVPTYIEMPSPAKKSKSVFAHVSDAELLRYGVPPEWLSDVRASTDQTILKVAAHLPSEAGEALLEIATGGTPRVTTPTPAAGPFEHPDAQRRFRVVANVQELQRALEFPWDKWTIFLHPDQRQWVERNHGGAARVSGSAGTGKTIVALHRAVYLARHHPDARVLLTTFSDILANDLQSRVNRLVSNEPHLAERIDVYSINAIGSRLYRALLGTFDLASEADVRELVGRASADVASHKFTLQFLCSEWDQIVDAWQLDSWEAYRDVARLGRKTKLAEPQRATVWSIFEQVQAELLSRNQLTLAGLFTRLAAAVRKSNHLPFDFIVVDEAQDISVAHLKFFAALGGGRPNALFFAGDLGQRIFQQPFSWKSVGVDVRGRSRTLRVNYRTSHQIRMQADRLLDGELSDVDENTEQRNDTVSVFNGPPPLVQTFESESEEATAVAAWILDRQASGVAPHEVALFIRSTVQLSRARAAIEQASLPFRILDESAESGAGRVTISTMHRAKGLEFRAVVVMACDDEIIPLHDRIDAIGDSADLKEVYDTERNMLYVACTRARDYLLVTGVEPASEFLADLKAV